MDDRTDMWPSTRPSRQADLQVRVKREIWDVESNEVEKMERRIRFNPVEGNPPAMPGFSRDGIEAITADQSRYIRISPEVLRSMFKDEMPETCWKNRRFNFTQWCIDPWMMVHWESAASLCYGSRQIKKKRELRYHFLRCLYLCRIGYNIKWESLDLSCNQALKENCLYTPSPRGSKRGFDESSPSTAGTSHAHSHPRPQRTRSSARHGNEARQEDEVRHEDEGVNPSRSVTEDNPMVNTQQSTRNESLPVADIPSASSPQLHGSFWSPYKGLSSEQLGRLIGADMARKIDQGGFVVMNKVMLALASDRLELEARQSAARIDEYEHQVCALRQRISDLDAHYGKMLNSLLDEINRLSHSK